MKQKETVEVSHPWWHSFSEHEHEKTHEDKDPDDGTPASVEVIVHSCSRPNCKFRKVEKRVWSTKK